MDKRQMFIEGARLYVVGIPAVMSAVGMNNQIIRHGRNGFLAENDSEWYYILSALIEDADARKEIGDAGRKTVMDSYSVEANKEKYLRVFQRRGL